MNSREMRDENYEIRKKILEYQLEIEQLKHDIFLKNRENEYLQNKIKIQDMIYFHKHINIHEFINNLVEKYYRGHEHENIHKTREWFDEMYDEWGQYLENIPLYEIKNVVHYIQCARADDLRAEWKNDFYTIFRNYYESLEIMKEQNIHSFRKKKINDMYREWSKYISLFPRNQEVKVRIKEVNHQTVQAVFASRGTMRKTKSENVIYLNL
jgi:hypothetical protein